MPGGSGTFSTEQLQAVSCRASRVSMRLLDRNKQATRRGVEAPTTRCLDFEPPEGSRASRRSPRSRRSYAALDHALRRRARLPRRRRSAILELAPLGRPRIGRLLRRIGGGRLARVVMENAAPGGAAIRGLEQFHSFRSDRDSPVCQCESMAFIGKLDEFSAERRCTRIPTDPAVAGPVECAGKEIRGGHDGRFGRL